ncbi:hypothetical protein PoB_002023500 [Plakobranchus ocellatus]|uniref:Uncharacterized protein n=1 Tax=Plakobranchus ocellatus TaxID=259542 RepID=A0AAV3ZGQ3_9GAST|nr:hypothetical protein PoB_002023500 [Plakobranchus ocellatus]
MSPDTVLHLKATQYIIMVELTVPYENSGRGKIHIKEKIQGLEQRAGKSGIQFPDIVFRGWRQEMFRNISLQPSKQTLHRCQKGIKALLAPAEMLKIALDGFDVEGMNNYFLSN